MSWKDDVKREVKDVVEEVLQDTLGSVMSNLDYRERYYAEQQEVQRLRRELEAKKNESPSDFQVQQWEEAAKTLKRLKDVKQQSYNEGYAAAYVDVTNRMKSGVPVHTNQGGY